MTQHSLAIRGGRRCRIWLCALLLCTAPCMAHDIRTAAPMGTEPKFQDADAPAHGIVGICIDILRAMERLDPRIKFSGDQTWLPLTRIYQELASGVEDASCGFAHTADRDRNFDYIGPPLYTIDYRLMVRMDDTVSINSWDDVRKLGANGVVLANRGFSATNVLEGLGGITVDAQSNSPLLNLQKLIAGRGRFFMHRGPGIQRYLARAGVADKVKILPTVMYSTQLYFVTSKHIDPQLKERLTRALIQLDKSGQLASLVRRWE
jgi:polar amino acid transport system substrate-binding protein